MIEEMRQKFEARILEDPNLSRGFEFRMSASGECVRKLDYELQTGKVPFSIEGALRVNMGEPIHEVWRKIVRDSFPDEIEHVESEVSIDIDVDGEILKVTGHPDGALREKSMVVEVKGTSDSTFSLIKNRNEPLDSHLAQGNMYAHALKKSFILFIYQNRDSGEFFLMTRPYSHELANQTIEKWKTVVRNKRAGIISPRPYQDATASPCWFCAFKEKCYEGFAEMVAGMATKEIDDPTGIALAGEYALARRMKLGYEKKEESFKTDLGLYMIDNNFNQMKTPVGDITLKIGKNNNPLVSIKEKKA